MSNILQIRRGITARRNAYTPADGEFVLDLTTKQLFVGDGTTAGGVAIKAVDDNKVPNDLSFSGGVVYRDVVSGYFPGQTMTGAIVIHLPVGMNAVSTMMSVKVSGFNYATNASSFEILCGFYQYATGLTIINPSANLSGSFPGERVRYAKATDHTVIILGDANTVWSYPLIRVSEMLAAHVSTTGWRGGWSARLETDLSGYTKIAEPILYGTPRAKAADKLTTARTIGGVSFDGTANINLPGVNTTGNQNTTGSAATLTTARTINGISFNGSANINVDLIATDSRAIKPTGTSKKNVSAYFTSKGGLNAVSSDSNYGDLLVLNSYNDTSGGKVNALFFPKNFTENITHYSAAQGDANWGTGKPLAYTSDLSAYLPLAGGMVTGSTSFTGAVYLGTSMPSTRTLLADNVPIPQTPLNTARRTGGGIELLKAFAGDGDYFANADRNPRYTITSNYGTPSSLFNGVMSDAISVPIANLATTPWVLEITSATSISATDVLYLGLIGHRLSHNGVALKSWKVESLHTVDNQWYTVLERTGVMDYVGNFAIPLNITGSIPGAASTSYHYTRGIRLTVSDATPAAFDPNNLRIAALQLRDTRPAFTPAAAINALDARGGDLFGDVNWVYGVPKISGNTIWHAGNDGLGSGLDADLLDGYQGSYYLNAANFTGTIDKARLPASIDAATTGNAATATQLLAGRTISATGDGTWSVSFDGTANASADFTLANTGVTAGTYKSVTVDAKGRVTAADVVLTGLVTSTTAAGTSNLATGNTNTYLNIVEQVGLAASSTSTSTQITGAGTVTVASDTAGKLTITGAQSITGNAATATKLATARTLNGVSFDGSANVTVPVPVTSISTNGVDLNTYQTPGMYSCSANAVAATLLNCPTTNAFSLLVERHAGIKQTLTEYMASGAKTYSRNFYGSWGAWYRVYTTIDAPTSVTGNAGTATKLATARTVSLTGDVTGSVSFDGSANASITSTIANKGVANGLATLDASGKVPVDQLPASAVSAQYLGTASTKAISYNAQTIDENIVIPGNVNALSAGPLTIGDGYTVTISDGAVWTIV